MTSQDGSGITTLSDAHLYNVQNSAAIDSGNSFSTPDVATKLYLARAFWKSKGLKALSSCDIRNRLLISTNLDSSLVMKYASGGALNFHKLLQSYQSMLIDKSGKIIHITSVAGEIKLNSGNDRGMGTDPGDFTSLYLTNNGFYYYMDNSERWNPIEIKDIDLTINVDASSIFHISKADFINQYQELVVFNKTSQP
jgi:hypothetical protein